MASSEIQIASNPESNDSDMVDGRVVDANGAGVAGVEVSFEPATTSGFGPAWAPHRGVSGADGSFRIPAPNRAGRITTASETWVTLAPVSWFARAPEPPVVVVVAEPCDLDGMVVDASGLPLEGVTVTVVLTLAESGAFPASLPTFDRPLGETRTGSDGVFSIPRLPYSSSATLFARRQGLVSRSLSLADNGWKGLIVRMTADRKFVDVQGVVLGEDGLEVEGARVAAGEVVVATDDRGRFSVSCSAALEGVAVWAVAPGIGSGMAWVDVTTPDRMNDVVVVLEGTRSSLSGTVVDGASVPQEGCLVKVLESTSLGRTSRKVGDLTFEQAVTVEQILAGQDTLLGKLQWCRTDERGAFTLDDLVDREYTVFVVRPSDLQHASFGPVRTGTKNVELVLARTAPRHVAGRVRTSDGKPLAGCAVVPVIVGSPSSSVSVEQRLPDEMRAKVVTDQSGGFDLGMLVTDSLVLSVGASKGTLSARIGLADVTDPSHLDVVLPSAASFTLEISEGIPRGFDGLRVEAEDGRALVVSFELISGASASGLSVPCPDGRVGIIGTDTRARNAVLLRDGQPVRTVPLDLAPGILTTVDVH